MTMPGTSRVRINMPTRTVQCTVLSEGYEHEIASRPENREIIARVVSVHGTGGRYAPIVTFTNGEVRRLILGEPTEMSDERISFVATMANGNDVVRVAVSFTGTSGGNVQILGMLG